MMIVVYIIDATRSSSCSSSSANLVNEYDVVQQQYLLAEVYISTSIEKTPGLVYKQHLAGTVGYR